MGRSRVVRPELAILPLSDGDSLTVKRRLTAGETRACYARMIRRIDGEWVRDPLEASMALILAFLVDWTLVDLDGHVIDIRDQPVDTVRRALEGFDHDSYNEIKTAIERHEQTMIAERDAEKKTRVGTPPSSATLPSPVAAAGVMNG